MNLESVLKKDIFIFDCDGVILDSNKIKTHAFRSTLAHHEQSEIEDFITYHMLNGGISRFEKFEYFCNSIHKCNSYCDMNEMLTVFSKSCRKLLAEAPITTGCIDFLNLLRSHGKTCFVNSGGKEDEVNEILKFKNLQHFFKEILGSPNTKNQNMERIKNLYDIDSSNCVFFGDAFSDYQCSKLYNIDFVFLSDFTEWDSAETFCKDRAISTYLNFSKLLNT